MKQIHMHPPTQLIVFDIDGTLSDSVSIHQQAFIAALKALGIEEMDTNFKTYKHHTDSYIAKTIYEKAMGLPFDQEVLLKFEAHLYAFMKERAIDAIKGAKAVIRYFEQQPDWGIAYATGSLLKPAAYKLAQIGVDYIDAQLVTANDFYDRASIVQTAINQAKIYYNQNDFETIVSVGDGLWDLKTAQALGVHFIGIGEKHKALLLREGAKLCWEDWNAFAIAEIEELIEA